MTPSIRAWIPSDDATSFSNSFKVLSAPTKELPMPLKTSGKDADGHDSSTTETCSFNNLLGRLRNSSPLHQSDRERDESRNKKEEINSGDSLFSSKNIFAFPVKVSRL